MQMIHMKYQALFPQKNYFKKFQNVICYTFALHFKDSPDD